MKTKKFSWFYAVLIIFVLLVLLLTEIGKSALRDVLRDFESVQVQYTADAVLERYFSADSAEALYSRVASDFSPYESRDTVRKFLADHLGDGLTVQCVSAGNEGTYTYAVRSKGLPFATFTLAPSGEKSKYGFEKYALQTLSVSDNLLCRYTAVVPVGYTLFVNENACRETDAVPERVPDESQTFMPDGVEGIFYAVYPLERLCGEPCISAKAPDGQSCQITVRDDIFRAMPVFSGELEEKYGAYAIEATKAYAAYMQNDQAFGRIKSYFDPDSALYTNIRTAETLWVIDHDGYRFEDARASEFLSYGDGVFSCRVTLTHILTRRGLSDYRDYLDMTWYFRSVNGQFKIYNSFNNK